MKQRELFSDLAKKKTHKNNICHPWFQKNHLACLCISRLCKYSLTHSGYGSDKHNTKGPVYLFTERCGQKSHNEDIKESQITL